MANQHHTPLDRCPFCGEEAEIVRPIVGGGVADANGYFGDVFVAQCHRCLSEGPGGETAAEAARAWNRRIPPAAARRVAARRA